MSLEYTVIHSASQYYQRFADLNYSFIRSQLGTTITIIFRCIINELNDRQTIINKKNVLIDKM